MTTTTKKTIAFLATGSELLNGDLLESNAHYSSKLVSEAGGTVQTKVITGDEKHNIQLQLLQLLEQHDAVITIGGLGPTSDDNTRYAVSEATQLPLEIHDASWLYIQERLTKFGLAVDVSNQKQALFPKGSVILNNPLGTANACHLQWQGRDIFMLPGPPKEFQFIFEHYIMPHLEKNNYFDFKETYRFLTMGLIEGEISTKVDLIAQQYQLTTAYRWSYPYLEIKLISENRHIDVAPVLKKINTLLQGFIVSSDGRNADDLIKELPILDPPIIIQVPDSVKTMLAKFLDYPGILFIENENTDRKSHSLVLKLDADWPTDQVKCKHRVELRVIGIQEGNTIFQHHLGVPMRESDIDLCIQAYFLWQLSSFYRFTQTMLP